MCALTLGYVQAMPVGSLDRLVAGIVRPNTGPWIVPSWKDHGVGMAMECGEEVDNGS